MTVFVATIIYLLLLATLPFLTLGIIRKMKARFQNRLGPPLFQSLYNILKLMSKGETVSTDSSYLFRMGPLICFATVLLLALLLPWVPVAPALPGRDLFLIVYLFALVRFFAIISSLDVGSPFGAFAASREATLSLLTEPAIVLALVALGLSVHTTDLGVVFAAPTSTRLVDVPLWILSGTALFLASLVELSRMPIDDPSTHLELTMVHEAMVIENSGPNLALIELSYALRLVLLFGLCAQCFVHALLVIAPLSSIVTLILVPVLILGLAAFTAVIESFAVKLAWRKNPEFIAYALTMSLLASLAAVVRGIIS